MLLVNDQDHRIGSKIIFILIFLVIIDDLFYEKRPHSIIFNIFLNVVHHSTLQCKFQLLYRLDILQLCKNTSEIGMMFVYGLVFVTKYFEI